MLVVSLGYMVGRGEGRSEGGQLGGGEWRIVGVGDEREGRGGEGGGRVGGRDGREG